MATTYELVTRIICETLGVTDQQLSPGLRIADVPNTEPHDWLGVLCAFEDALGIDMDENEFEDQCGTIADIVELVAAKREAREAA